MTEGNPFADRRALLRDAAAVAGGPYVVPEGTPGAITIIGRMYDGAGNVIPTGWSRPGRPTRTGRFAHPDDPRGAVPGGYRAFRGFGRCPTAPDGSYRIVTLKPGPLPARAAGHRGAAPGRLGVRARPARPGGDQDVLPGRARPPTRPTRCWRHPRTGPAGHADRRARTRRRPPVRHLAARRARDRLLRPLSPAEQALPAGPAVPVPQGRPSLPRRLRHPFPEGRSAVLPWSADLAGRIDEHVISSELLRGTRSVTRMSGRCSSTCRPATTTSPAAGTPPCT